MYKIKNLNSIILLVLSVLFSFQILAQKSRKKFSYLQENNLNIAQEEYAKIKFYKVSDNVIIHSNNFLISRKQNKYFIFEIKL